MSTQQSAIETQAFLRYLLKATERLTAAEIAAVSNGEAVLSVTVKKKRQRRTRPATTVEVDGIIEQLNGCAGRDEASTVLTELGLTKAQLRILTKALDLTYQKDDTVDRMIDRLIESTVGFRLRSQAIQGQLDSEKAG